MPEEVSLSVSHAGLSTTALKYIAMLSMVLDHCTIFFSADSAVQSFVVVVFRWLGSMSVPLFAFCLVEGYHHTRNVKRYITRLGVLALISYFPYIWFFAIFSGTDVSYMQFNIFFSLFLGLLALVVYRSPLRKWNKVFVLGLLVLTSIPTDGSWFLIALMLAYEVYYSDHRKRAACVAAIIVVQSLYFFLFTCGFWHDIVSSLRNGIPFFEWYLSTFSPDAAKSFVPVMCLFHSLCKFGGLLSIPLVARYTGRRGGERFPRFNKWFFYAFYPVHLLVLAVVYQWGF